MGRRGVTLEAVEVAYDALREAGLNPSIRNIREQLGNTGSLQTIAEHVRAIQSVRWDGAGPALPDPLIANLIQGARTYWSDLAAAADDQIIQVKAQADAIVAAACTERDEAVQQAQQRQDELSAHRVTVQSLQQHMKEKDQQLEHAAEQTQAAIDDQNQTKQELDSLLVASDSQRQEKDDYKARLATIETKLKASTSLNDQLRTDVERQSIAHKQSVDALQRTLDELQGRHDKQQTSLDQLRIEHDATHERLLQTESARSKLSASERDLHRQLEQQAQIEVSLCKQIEQLTAVNDQLQQERRANESSSRQLLVDQHATMERLENQLSQLMQKGSKRSTKSD